MYDRRTVRDVGINLATAAVDTGLGLPVASSGKTVYDAVKKTNAALKDGKVTGKEAKGIAKTTAGGVVSELFGSAAKTILPGPLVDTAFAVVA